MRYESKTDTEGSVRISGVCRFPGIMQRDGVWPAVVYGAEDPVSGADARLLLRNGQARGKLKTDIL